MLTGPAWTDLTASPSLRTFAVLIYSVESPTFSFINPLSAATVQVVVDALIGTLGKLATDYTRVNMVGSTLSELSIPLVKHWHGFWTGKWLLGAAL